MTASVMRAAGAICLACVWLLPISLGLSKDALQQVFAFGLFGIVALLLGTRTLLCEVWIAIGAGVALILLNSSPYVEYTIIGIAGLVLLGLAGSVGSQLRRVPANLPWVLWAVVFAALINAVLGWLQWLWLVDGGPLAKLVMQPEQRGVAFGIFRQRNLFATFLCVGVVCALWLVQIRRLSESMAWLVVGALVSAVVASASRTGAIEVFTLTAVGLFWRRQETSSVARLLIGLLPIFVVASVTLPVIAELHGFGFATGAERTLQSHEDGRLVLWRNAVSLITARPWLGWGWQETSYGFYSTDFVHRWGELTQHVHNLPLQIAVEFGLPAALAFMALLIWGVWKGKPWRMAGKEADGERFAWLILLLIVGIHSMLEFPLWYAWFLIPTGLAIGYLMPGSLAAAAGNGKFNIDQSPMWRKYGMTIYALVIVLLAGVAWQQYDKVLLLSKVPFNDRVALRSAMNAAADSWMFRAHLDFVELSMEGVSPSNAATVRQQSEKLLHFSAEPQVIQSLLQSLSIQKDHENFRSHLTRYCYAFPLAAQHWINRAEVQPMLIASDGVPQPCLSLQSRQ